MNNNQLILNLFKKELSHSAIELSESSRLGLRTVQRVLNSLVQQQAVMKTGVGKNTVYKLSGLSILNYEPKIDIDLNESRMENNTIQFNFHVLDWLRNYNFSNQEAVDLESAKVLFQHKIKNSSPILKQREYERLIVEFSWKSSSIEGDTYTLLDTQKLLIEGIANKNKTFEETQMILNHKSALDFIFHNSEYFANLSVKKITELHKILTNKLSITHNFRKSGVGITGSIYKPLDNQRQIGDAIEELCILVNNTERVYLKALFVSVIIPYIHPFEDGNKRTSRILANAILFSQSRPLLSYRNTNVEEYRNAILGFYEMNSINLFKKIFVDQIVFFGKNYF